MDATADAFMERLLPLQSDEELRKIQRYFKSGKGDYGHGDHFIGVRMGHVFELAKAFLAMPAEEIERLLESDIHEARAGAMSIMAKRYRLRTTTEGVRQALYDLYLRRHDRINNWDLVDLAAWHVVGAHLVARDRDVLYRLARSPSLWERRTAILATYAFIRRGDFADTLALAEILMEDREDLIHKSVGWMLRSIGASGVRSFLDVHAAGMPRAMLRATLEAFPAQDRAAYMAMGAAVSGRRVSRQAPQTPG